jgi:antitoxin component YwqK of YwqJK toxin-antitoxin module/Zn-dependent protease
LSFLLLVFISHHASAEGPLVNALKEIPQLGPVKDGPQTEYYSDGKVESKANYKNGKLDGLKQGFDHEGALREESNFVNGLEEGEHKQFNDHGKLEAQWADINGRRDGVYRSYFPDGKLAEERQYASGLFLDANGKPYNGTYIVNFPDGKVYKKLTYKNGLADGVFQVYALKGFLLQDSYFVDDKKHGVFTLYDENTGKLKTKVNFKNDVLDGVAQDFENGKIVREYQYVDGDRNGLGKEYDEDGGHWETTYVKDVAQGIAKYFDSENLLRATQEIKDGQPVGDVVYYDAHGKTYVKGVVLDAKNDRVLLFCLWLFVFLFSLTVHEAAHAWSAHRLGDETAYKGGQVSLNPVPHIRREPIGMLVLPILSYWGQGWMIGWASAPYNPKWALEHPRRSALMALAGPLSNLMIVFIAGCAIRIGLWTGFFTFSEVTSAESIIGGVSSGLPAVCAAFCGICFYLNTVLFGFNLLPFPPLDGTAIFQLILPKAWAEKYMLLVNNRATVIIGLIVAWNLFDKLAGIIFGVFFSVLFFGT